MSMMSLRLIILKYKSFFGRIVFFTGLFLIFHFLIIPTLIIKSHGGQPNTGLANNPMEMITYYKPLDVVSSNDLWQVVNDPYFEVFLLSAFFDDRPSLLRFQVRVVAVAEVASDGLTCLLWYRNRKEPDVIPANMTLIGDKIEQHGKMFQSVVFSCEVPAKRWPPEWVSIVGRDSIVPANLVRVEMPYRPPMLRDITVCVPPSYGEISETRFTEWLEILAYMGVTKVTIYDNGLTSSLRSVIKAYQEKGMVDLRKTSFPMTADNRTLTRKLITGATINDCFYRNMMEFSKVTVHDLNEIIIPRIHDTYPELVTYLDDTLPPHPGRSYSFKSVFFWLDFPAFTEDTPFMTVTRYLMRTPPSANPDTQRSITDSQVCLALYTRQCQELLPHYKNLTDWLTPVNMNISMMHHYKKCDLDVHYDRPGLCNDTYKMAEMDAIGTKYVDKVTTPIVETLWKFDLVDIFNLAEQSFQETLSDEMAMNQTRSAIDNGREGDGRNKTEGEKEEKEAKEEDLDVPMDPMVIIKDTRVSFRPMTDSEIPDEDQSSNQMGQEIENGRQASNEAEQLGQTQTDEVDGQTKQNDRQDRQANLETEQIGQDNIPARKTVEQIREDDRQDPINMQSTHLQKARKEERLTDMNQDTDRQTAQTKETGTQQQMSAFIDKISNLKTDGKQDVNNEAETRVNKQNIKRTDTKVAKPMKRKFPDKISRQELKGKAHTIQPKNVLANGPVRSLRQGDQAKTGSHDVKKIATMMKQKQQHLNNNNRDKKYRDYDNSDNNRNDNNNRNNNHHNNRDNDNNHHNNNNNNKDREHEVIREKSEPGQRRPFVLPLSKVSKSEMAKGKGQIKMLHVIET